MSYTLIMQSDDAYAPDWSRIECMFFFELSSWVTSYLSGTDAVKYHSLSIRTVFSNYLRHKIGLFTISTWTVQTFNQIVSIGIVTKALSKHDQHDMMLWVGMGIVLKVWSLSYTVPTMSTYRLESLVVPLIFCFLSATSSFPLQFGN